MDDLPADYPESWDIGIPNSDESYVPAAETLKEEADKERDGPPAGGKKAPEKPKKGEVAKAPEPLPGPLLELTAGLPLPEISIRLRTATDSVVTGESGRCFLLSIFREKLQEGADGIIEEPYSFGDKRPAGFGGPPPDAKGAKKVGKEAPPPDVEPIVYDTGSVEKEGKLGQGGFMNLGGSEEWLLPAHMQEAYYYLKVQDVTPFDPAMPFKPIAAPLKMPVRVKAFGS